MSLIDTQHGRLVSHRTLVRPSPGKQEHEHVPGPQTPSPRIHRQTKHLFFLPQIPTNRMQIHRLTSQQGSLVFGRKTPCAPEDRNSTGMGIIEMNSFPLWTLRPSCLQTSSLHSDVCTAETEHFCLIRPPILLNYCRR